MNRKNTFWILSFAFAVILLQVSCGYDHKKPGWEYMPDMVHSLAYETNTMNPYLPDSMTEQAPLANTIPLYMGSLGNPHPYQPYHYANNDSGYNAAGRELKNPFEATDENLAYGKKYFEIYCAVCHGKDGKANGPIVENPQLLHPFPPPPSYFSDNLLNLPEGKMYHSVHYGKGLMGAYSKLLDHDQLWKVILYVKKMQSDFIAAQNPSASTVTDSTSTKN